MWTRKELKTNAKQQMKGKYFTYLGVSLIPQLAYYVINIPISIIGNIMIYIGLFSSGILNVSSGYSSSYFDYYNDLGNFESLEELLQVFIPMLPGMLFIIIATVIGMFFIMIPVQVGMTRWFVRSREERNLSISLCFSLFKRGAYLKTVGSIIYYMFFLFLWSMLFYIPGIIKMYSYRMIPYILADNPQIGAKKALKLSCKMTKGHKLDIFILDLSFIGWYILGLMACCIGVIAVVPYYYATNAELYDTLKKEAVNKEYCSMEDLGYVLKETEQ